MQQEELVAKTADLLRRLGMDQERCNYRSCVTFLALAHLDTSTPWSKATAYPSTIRQLMDWIRDHLGIDYKPNTRETIRRFTLHQFVAGGIVEQNADDPNRPVNSPKNNYRITPSLLPVLWATGTDSFEELLSEFLAHISMWTERVAMNRELQRIPVSLPNGSTVTLSPGGQNGLLKQMVEEFCPRFVPDGSVLYLDDADKTLGDVATSLMEKLNITLPTHGKAPDLIVWDSVNHWLFLMEACSSQGPIDVTRRYELMVLFKNVQFPVVFVSCFPSRLVMRRFLADLAWETEAWCADSPDHMIHLDGERFFGPYD